MKFTFVILHYNNIDDTINCINTIKKLKVNKNDEVKIILIDNKSTNHTGTELASKYSNDKQIKVILLNKNYGFSYANNIGYKIAKKEDSDVILVSNNDILINDEEFLSKLTECYSKSDADIICPDIINLKNQHQNPLRNSVTPVKKAYKNMIYEYLFYICMFIPLIRKVVLMHRINREEKWFKNYYNNKISYDEDNFIPFGAFIIYTKNWINNEKIAFPSDTFMYSEEDMLYLYIRNKKYKMYYDSNLKVKHLEGKSTTQSLKNIYEKYKFQSKTKANSLKKYIRFYKKWSSK